MKVSPLDVKIPGANSLGTQAVKQRYLSPWGYTHWDEQKREKEWVRAKSMKNDRLHSVSLKYMWWNHTAVITQAGVCVCVDNSQSAFFKDCFFLEGLEMTLILLLRNTPMLALFPYNIFTDSMKCFLLSESLIYSVLAVQKCWGRENNQVRGFCIWERVCLCLSPFHFPFN